MMTRDENELCTIVSLKIFVLLEVGGMSRTLEGVENKLNLNNRWLKTK